MTMFPISALLLAMTGVVIAGPYNADRIRVRRFAGGQDVTDDSFQSLFPFAVAITNRNEMVCGATIISPTQILTTASCTSIFRRKNKGSAATIAVGSPNPSRSSINITLVDVALHPKYNETRIQHDIAVVTFEPALTYSDKVKPALLPKTDVLDNSVAKSIGWGSVKEVGATSKTLQMLDQKIISAAECKKLMPNPERVTAAYEICVIPTVGVEKAGSCNGDGGSPLVQDGTIVGMLSWGLAYHSLEQCHSGYPDIYLNLFKYLDFINEKIIQK